MKERDEAGVSGGESDDAGNRTDKINEVRKVTRTGEEQELHRWQDNDDVNSTSEESVPLEGRRSSANKEHSEEAQVPCSPRGLNTPISCQY